MPGLVPVLVNRNSDCAAVRTVEKIEPALIGEALAGCSPSLKIVRTLTSVDVTIGGGVIFQKTSMRTRSLFADPPASKTRGRNPQLQVGV